MVARFITRYAGSSLCACTLIGLLSTCQIALGQSGVPARPAPSENLQARTPTTPKPSAASLDPEVDQLWAALAGAGSLPDLAAQSHALLARTIIAGQTSQFSGPAQQRIVRVATVWRVINHVSQLAQSTVSTPELRRLLGANPQLASTIALSVRPGDRVEGVYSTLLELAQKFPDECNDGSRLMNLIAATCVVFDQPRQHPTYLRPGASAGEVFTFFRENQKRLQIPVADMPVQLLVHVVSVHVTRDEMEWALATYPSGAPGNLFTTIQYDTKAYKEGATKKILALGGGNASAYTLANIKKVGGVCAEQGYFATEVRKCLGVPAIYMVARGSDVGHAWAAFLRKDKRWEMSEGRNAGDGQYRDLTGLAIDPQTQGEVSEGEIAVSSGLLGVSGETIRAALALIDAAGFVRAVRAHEASDKPTPLTGIGAADRARAFTTSTQLALLESALKMTPALTPLWLEVSTLGERGELTAKQLEHWGDMLMRAAGRQSSDYALLTLTPMIQGVKDPAAQSGMWDWAANTFQARPDLAGLARLEQAQMWARANDPARAYTAYQELITRYANEGQVIVHALAGAENLLHAEKKDSAVVALYADAFRRINRPKRAGEAYFQSSTYFKVGVRYATLLDAAGKPGEAAKIEQLLGLSERRK